MARGILASCTAPMAPGVTEGDVRTAYEKATADEPFWHLLPAGRWPQTQSVLGSNGALVQIAVDVHAGRLLAVVAIDNLTKGTAGGAIQSMNLAVGLDETTGLTSLGVAP
jgi:N-acetyl-gamma-glutamyl-phosphate reductase